MPSTRPKPVLLAILDGWGCAGESADNAIAQARTPNMDALMAAYPLATLNASEHDVGLPDGQMGNSEVGHMNIGAGRVVMQDLPRIDTAIADGSLAAHPRLREFIAQLKASGGACHLLGLMSDGGVHAHQRHMAALANIVAAEGVPVWAHLITDGRDTPPQSALGYLESFINDTKGQPLIRAATVCGRYFAMDRDQRWERVERAYRAMAEGEGIPAASAAEAIASAYRENEKGDEFILPAIVSGYQGMKSGDGVLMANFRADRAREILSALLNPGFDGFARPRAVAFAATLGMVEYSESLNPLIPALFPPEELTGLLGEVVAGAGMTQLRIAETEKYAHVTFFFSGGREEPYPGEERILIPSPKVATYDLKPEMSAYEVTDALERAIASQQFDLIVVNYANTDMVGHTGDIEAAKHAVEAVDACVGRISQAVLKQGGAMLVTADHGNAEQMFDDHTNQAHTAHTLNLVPALLVGNAFKGRKFSDYEGRLADIAPTLLSLLHLPKPPQMTGVSLLDKLER